MLRSIGNSPSPEIESIVKGLLKEDSDYDRHESRSAHRESLVRAVTIEVRRPKEIVLSAFSRNISGSGIGLITDEKIADSSTAVLTIEPLKDRPSKILAECRWCKPYGKNWFISGWLFMMVKN